MSPIPSLRTAALGKSLTLSAIRRRFLTDLKLCQNFVTAFGHTLYLETSYRLVLECNSNKPSTGRFCVCNCALHCDYQIKL